MSTVTDRIAEIRNRDPDETRIRQRRDQIIAAAVQLFSDQGYYRTKVQDIAKRAGISTGLIYQYVKDKEDLLLLAILDVLDSYAIEIPLAVRGKEDPLKRCCTAFRTYCQIVDSRRDATLLAYRSTKSLSPKRRQAIMDAERQTNQIINGYVQACIDQGLFRPVNGEIVTYQMVMYAHAWALKHWQLAKHFTLDEYISHGYDFLLHAMLTRKGWAHLERYNSMD